MPSNWSFPTTYGSSKWKSTEKSLGSLNRHFRARVPPYQCSDDASSQRTSKCRGPYISIALGYHILELSSAFHIFVLSITMSRWWTSLFSVFIIVILNSSFCASRTPGDFSPPRVPLGIRSPYYNAWVSNDPVVPQWPNFWSTGVCISSPFSRSLTYTFSIDSWMGGIRSDRWGQLGMDGNAILQHINSDGC